ncbi:YhgE/Pip domain-containing protein [Rhodococcus sp. IEGM 1379]|uniref:YhgE/Pip domain-containing protein n=1 Tax=Rhodococcus sp. IEGM 1379 TaxID=3047086 RepID=UPI0024B6F27A|nr:YhgE/Pip domain-containing protein [Rhodococcus sp. IEGM 1379]MDI9913939.1 YhgE/Pip domain-containing protein [Rhodococcus sp. IEGM 1379]
MSPSASDASTRRTHLIRTILAVLVIAPLSMAAFYMWALWNPGDTVNQLPVAIVNADAGTDLDGTRLEAGTEVVSALVDSGDVAWKVVTAQEAKDGVDDGTFYFSVVIPENFSADVASAATGSGRKAQLQVVYNDYNSLVATPVGESVIAQVRSAVSESIGEQSIDQVLVGLGDLGAGFGEAAVGAKQLSDGTGQALAGTKQLHDGSKELATGLGEANQGGKELAAGTGELAAGADEASAGSKELNTGMAQLVAGTDELGAGAGQISEVVDMVTTPILDLVGSSGQVVGQIDSLITSLRFAGDPVSVGLVDALSGLRATLTAQPAEDDIVSQLGQLRDGAREITSQLTDPKSDYRGGLNAAAAGVGELSSGLGELSSGAHQLDSGANELSSGLGQLAAGSIELRDGLGELSTGVGELDAGSNELAQGLTDGAAQVPQFTEEERSTTANLLSAPVSVDARNSYPAAGFGPGAVPAVMSVILFLFGILTWFVVRPRRGRSEQVHSSVVREGLRRYRVPALVTLVAALVLSVVSLTIANVDPPSVVAMIAVMILVGGAAVALGRLFTVVFGPINGTFIALGALMIQIFAFGAVYPIEQMPAPLQWLHALMPLTWARNAMRMVLVGYYGPKFWLAVAGLFLLVVGAVAFTIWWRRRQEPTPDDNAPITEEIVYLQPTHS